MITLSATKNYLRLEHDEDDDLITSFINAAQEMVNNHTGKALSSYEGEVYPETLKIAALQTVAYWYSIRLPLVDVKMNQPMYAIQLLNSYREVL